MIQKIISGGESGVEEAALDIAVKMNISRGGWISSWRKNELGKKADHYQLQEMPGVTHSRIAEYNLRNSDGVLIIAKGETTGNPALYRRMAQKFNLPCLYVDLEKMSEFQASEQIISWVRDHQIRIVYITGSNDSADKFYDTVSDILDSALMMLMAEPPAPGELSDFFRIPKDVEEASEMLADKLTFREKTKIANSRKDKLLPLALSLGTYIRSEFRLDTNDALMGLCRKITGSDEIDEAILLIVERMWEKLQKGNVLRVVKH